MGSIHKQYHLICCLSNLNLKSVAFKMSAEEAKKEAIKKVEASAKNNAVAKAKKSAGAKKGPKVEIKKLTYLEMVTEAIKALKDRMGSSRQAITRYIIETHKVDAAKVIHIRKAIAHGIEKGILKQARASGKGAGSFRVVKGGKPEKASKPKKPVAKKVVKASSAGASSAKKNLQKKTIKKVAPKKVVKKAGAKTTKPAKKPSTAKKAEKPAKKQAVPSKKTKSK